MKTGMSVSKGGMQKTRARGMGMCRPVSPVPFLLYLKNLPEKGNRE